MQRLIVDGRDTCELRVADSYLTRLRGLLGTRGTAGALLLSPCNGVHGMGMAYSLDVALLAEDWTVRRVAVLRPFGLVPPRRGVRHVLEAQRGAFERWGLAEGSRLQAAGARSAPAGPA